MHERERVVPFRIGRLTDLLVARPFPPDAGPDAVGSFRALSRVVSALVHVELLGREHAVTDAWERLGDDPSAIAPVLDELGELVTRANFVPVDVAAIDEAAARSALVRLRLEVDLDLYEHLLVHRRGSRTETFAVPRWRGLRTKVVTTVVDDRVVICSQLRSAEWFAAHDVDAHDRGVTPGATSLKLFRDVPRPDLEMLLPATRIRFRRIDVVKVGLPALTSAVLVATTKLLPTLGLLLLLVAAAVGLRRDSPEIDQDNLLLLVGGAFALGLYLWRQWRRYENRRIKYLKILNENLYFRTVADGAGVFHTLYAAAEEQEVAEVLLAHRVLLDAADGLTAADLDAEVEALLRDDGAADVDFEVDDALAKAHRLGIVREHDGRHHAVPLRAALEVLDGRWQALFRHDESTVTTVPHSGATGSGVA